MNVSSRIEEVADRHPDRLALRGPSTALTYAELIAEADRLARGLTQRFGPGSAPVALLMSHDAPLAVALLAVLRGGRPVLVLDESAPEALTRSLLERAEVPLVLTDDAWRDAARAAAPAGTTVATADELRADPGPVAPPAPAAPDDPAVYAHTSGTTDDPKIAVVPHRTIDHLVVCTLDALGITAADRMPMLFPLSRAAAVYPLFLPFASGGTLSTFDVRGRGLADLPTWLRDEGITVMHLAPILVRFLADAVGEVRFPDLRLVALGGERLDAGLVELTWELFGRHVDVVNGYGTTETGVLTFHRVDPSELREGESVLAGHPIPGVELGVVDDDGQPLPPGRVGELEVTGEHLFRGYVGVPEPDDQVFDGVRGASRTYRTGDLARLDADGRLDLVGRTDAQVKVRGMRVVLGEVEQSLIALPEVAEAVVVAEPSAAGGDELVAHVLLDEAAGPDTTGAALRRTLDGRLAPHVVPARIVVHETFPQLPNGKIDRRALHDRRPAPAAAPDADPDAGDATVRAVIGIWEDLLGVPVGPDDDFLDLGGHSLLAALMLVRVEEDLGARVPMDELLDRPTPARLAALVQGGERRRQASTVVCVQPGSADRPPFYIAHDLHGSSFRFRHLAAAMGTDQPVFSFESPFLSGERLPVSSVQTLALRYVTDLLAHQPSGPYHLGGYSFGGVLAYEMARQLRREGEEVGLLAVVDVGPGYRGEGWSRRPRPPLAPWFGITPPPAPGTPPVARLRHYADMVRRSPRGALRHVAHRVDLDRWLLPPLWERQLRRDGVVAPGHRVWYAWRKHWELVGRDWDPGPYDGRVTLFWSEDSASADATMGWGDVAGGGVEIHRLDVSHTHIMDEDLVDRLAGPLRAALDRAS